GADDSRADRSLSQRPIPIRPAHHLLQLCGHQPGVPRRRRRSRHQGSAPFRTFGRLNGRIPQSTQRKKQTMSANHQKPITASDTPAFFGIDRYGFPEAGEHPVDPPEYYPPYFWGERFQKLGYHVEELRGGFYWVTSGGYDAAFVVTDEGVIAIDAPPTLGENMLAAIEEVTDKRVTHVIYSHWHTDHIGAASIYGPDVEIIAHEITKELLERFPDPGRPLPTLTFNKEHKLTVGGVTLELSYKGENHCPGNIFIYATAQKVLTCIDIISPGSATFMH